MTEDTTDHESVLAPLREKHGDIASWVIPKFGLVVAARPANPAEYDRMVNTLRKPGVDQVGTLRAFAMQCIVHPDREEVKRIFEKYPAFAPKVADRAADLCGGEFEELGKD